MRLVVRIDPEGPETYVIADESKAALQWYSARVCYPMRWIHGCTADATEYADPDYLRSLKRAPAAVRDKVIEDWGYLFA